MSSEMSESSSDSSMDSEGRTESDSKPVKSSIKASDQETRNEWINIDGDAHKQFYKYVPWDSWLMPDFEAAQAATEFAE